MPQDETKREKFERLAIDRTRKAMKRIDLIGNLSATSNYEWTEADVDKIFGALEAEIAAARKRFTGSDEAASEFTL